MRILLDTHAFLWFVTGDPRTSATAQSLILDPVNEKLVSIASMWEIAIKFSSKKLLLTEPYDVLIPREIKQNAFKTLDITFPHTVAVAQLPYRKHRDPFDRLLAAQAIFEAIPMLSDDAALDSYGITRLW